LQGKLVDRSLVGEKTGADDGSGDSGSLLPSAAFDSDFRSSNETYATNVTINDPASKAMPRKGLMAPQSESGGFPVRSKYDRALFSPIDIERIKRKSRIQ
jgi:hypothetical protein